MLLPKIGVSRVDETPFAPLTRRLSDFIVPRLPLAVTPNHVTVFGCIAALLAGGAFYLAGFHKLWFIVAAIALFVYSIADCVDGTLARSRRMVSEKGFFLDIFLDDVAFAGLYLGLAFAHYTVFEIVALGAIIHLLSDVVVTLRIHLRDQHVIPSFGPTEICWLLVLGAMLTLWRDAPLVVVGGRGLGWFDFGFIAGTAGGLIELVLSARTLYRELEGPVQTTETKDDTGEDMPAAEDAP